jgi:hypothetical protein
MGGRGGFYYFRKLNTLKMEKLAEEYKSYKFSQIMKGILTDRQILKRCKTTIFKAFSTVLSYNTKTMTTLKTNKSRIKAMDMNILRSTEGSKTRGRIRNGAFRGVELQNLLRKDCNDLTMKKEWIEQRYQNGIRITT